MERVALESIKSISGINSLNKEVGSDSVGAEGLGFKDVFEGLIENVKETEAATKVDAYNMSIGNMDDMHTMMINAAKADVALQTMVQIRNKVLDAYSEVMRINL